MVFVVTVILSRNLKLGQFEGMKTGTFGHVCEFAQELEENKNELLLPCVVGLESAILTGFDLSQILRGSAM